MKRLLVIIVGICAFLPTIAHASSIDLTKLPKAQRDSAAIQIAIATMKKYAPSYYDESIIPTVKDVTYDNEGEHKEKPSLVVEFFFDYGKAIKEGRVGENVYGGKVYIWAETGEPLGMLPTGWMVYFVIGNTGTRGSQPKIARPSTVPRKLFE